ncbi:M23 family metallopeptidase [Ramlibacter terrae]|uniref:M23 family metallopeptidase n=1 Tax=Ramlibacter terrae TaxID=2732511 RepID=A0ABX6P508_9BURK|nr:M23 family metallopeptidase [Ramlibacter terrae]
MHFIITDERLAGTRTLRLSGARLALAFAAFSLLLLVLAGMLYHWVVQKSAREGWPVLGTLVQPLASDELAQRDRFLRENVDAMARKLGEMQAKMMQLEAPGERVSGLAGVNPNELKTVPGRGGALVSGRPLSMEELQDTLVHLDELADHRKDLLTVMETRLFDQRVNKLMIPTQKPVQVGQVGSAFGWRIDPFTGRSALHTGLDFRADPGTAIHAAAAGGVVVAAETHFAYGNMVEVDHGNDLVTRYAHASRLLVKKGDLVKRGQKLAEVGSSGRSTGPHLHFEVMVQGVYQDPHKFLGARNLQVAALLPPGQSGRVGR